MQKKVLGSIALVFVVNILIKPLWILLIDRGVQNTLGYEAYGEYASMFSIAMMLTMLLDFGINNYNSSVIANNPASVTSQFAELVPLKLLLSTIYFVLTLLIAFWFGFDQKLLPFIAWLAFNQILAHFSTYLRSSISGLQLFKTDALLSGLDRLLMLILGATMLWLHWLDTNISNFIFIQTAGYIGICLIAFAMLWPRLTSLSLRFNRKLLIELFQKTYPYALLAFIMLLYTRMDVLLIKNLLNDGNYQNGVYASGGRLLEAAVLMVGAVSTILLPVFARMFAQQQPVKPMVTMLVVLLLIPATVAAAVCSAYSLDVLRIVSPETDDYTASVFSWLILAFIPYTAMYIFGSLLTAKGELKALIIICFIALVVNIILNLWLIPLHGAWGAALTALITQCIVGFGKMTYTVIRVKQSVNLKLLLYITTHIAVSLAAAYVLKQAGTSVIVSSMILFAWASLFTLIMKIYKPSALLAEFRSLVKM